MVIRCFFLRHRSLERLCADQYKRQIRAKIISHEGEMMAQSTHIDTPQQVLTLSHMHDGMHRQETFFWLAPNPLLWNLSGADKGKRHPLSADDLNVFDC